MINRPTFWLLYKLKRRIPALLAMTAAHVLHALLGVAFALGTRDVIDAAVSGSRPDFLRACLVQGAIILGILLTLTVFRHLHDRLEALLDQDWKKDLLHTLLRGDYAAVSDYHSGELINRLNNDVRIVGEGLLTTLPGLAAMLTRLIAAAIVLIRMEPRFAYVVLAAGVLVVVITAWMRSRLKGLHKRVSEADGRVSSFLQEALEKLLMVQAMDVSDEMDRRADALLSQRYHAQRKRKNVSLFANTSVSALSYLAGFAALIWCSFGLLGGTMTFGSLTAITHLVSQLQGPFVNLSGVIPKYIAMTAAAERLRELDALSETKEPPAQDPAPLYEKMQAICAEHLSFSYNRDAVFTDASFSLPKGSFTVVTGQSGIGKSTLLKLLLGVFKPSGGALYLENEENSALDRSTRRLFSYVPQGNLLLSGTLRDNLLIAKPDATDAELQQALHVSAADEFLAHLPHGMDTVLGENGIGLSEGQIQRLAIARALLGGAPILLLDEATSALDAETERTVLMRIRALEKRTCIVVTHRPAALELADLQVEVSEQKLIVREKGGDAQ